MGHHVRNNIDSQRIRDTFGILFEIFGVFSFSLPTVANIVVVAEEGHQASFVVDCRTAKAPASGRYMLPADMELVNGDPVLEDQEDGSRALVVPEGAHLKCALRCSPWILQEDGRLHQWTLLCAMRLDRLPSSALAIASGRPAPASGERTENAQAYKNGGVGALGHMGTQEAASQDFPATQQYAATQSQSQGPQSQSQADYDDPSYQSQQSQDMASQPMQSQQ